ncbi:Gfo/Idh/MocA family oxidoreductase [Desulfobacterales bacterium HSG17]|nr:Gfo/Idh/MocA family oxidoreductase [Desulfobacterales bacterium HSG17]
MAGFNNIRIGVIGTGYLGKYHTEKYAHLDNVELVGVVDVDANAAEKVALDNATKPFTDYRALFGKVDAVSVVVPTKYHYEISKEFLQQGVDVLIEKPMTVTLSEADELIKLASMQNRIIQVGHLERFNPAVKALKGIVENPQFIESHRLSTYKDRGTDVSVVLDLMIHDIDIIQNFVASDVTEIRAAGISIISQYPDIANARLEFKNGCVANVTASRISMKNERKIRLFQPNAYISVDFANHEIKIVRQDQTKTEAIIPGMEIETITMDHGDALDDEIRHFVHSVENRSIPEVDGNVGRKALFTALEIIEQISSTQPSLLS